MTDLWKEIYFELEEELGREPLFIEVQREYESRIDCLEAQALANFERYQEDISGN